jgi:tight adherence protein B
MILGLSPIIILAAALLILIGFGFSGLLVSTDQAKAKRLVVRRETVLRPHMRTQSIDIALFTRAAADETTILARATSWFGIDLERTDICPVPWWTVVAAAAIAADAALSGLSMLLGPYTWIAFPLFWMGASRAVFAYFKGKRREKLIVQFPDALMMIVRSVRVGVPVGEAIHIIAQEQPQPTAGEFQRVANQLSIGEPMDKAILAMARHSQLAEHRFFATALTLQSKTGGALSGTLENLAEMIRKRVAVKERAHALASEARLSIYVLTGLPVFVAGAIVLLNPGYISLLITDPLGNKLLIAAVMSLMTGLGIMQVIVKKSVS